MQTIPQSPSLLMSDTIDIDFFINRKPITMDLAVKLRLVIVDPETNRIHLLSNELEMWIRTKSNLIKSLEERKYLP